MKSQPWVCVNDVLVVKMQETLLKLHYTSKVVTNFQKFPPKYQVCNNGSAFTYTVKLIPTIHVDSMDDILKKFLVLPQILTLCATQIMCDE